VVERERDLDRAEHLDLPGVDVDRGRRCFASGSRRHRAAIMKDGRTSLGNLKARVEASN
jgi:hypothetical protein